MRDELVERARRGDREAFGRLAEEEIGRLRIIARLVLRDADLAEDAVQEALLRCWRQLPKLRDVRRFDAWLTRILVHAASDELARHRRFRAAVRDVAAEPSEGDTTLSIGVREQLERGFARLSIEQRAVVVLHHYAGLTMTEVAAALEVPPGTVKSRYHYALASLRAALEADDRAAIPGEVLA